MLNSNWGVRLVWAGIRTPRRLADVARGQSDVPLQTRPTPSGGQPLIHAIAEYGQPASGTNRPGRKHTRRHHRAVAHRHSRQFGQVVIGTPEDAIAQIERLIEKTGGFGTPPILHVMANWDTVRQLRELSSHQKLSVLQEPQRGLPGQPAVCRGPPRIILSKVLVGAITKAHNDWLSHGHRWGVMRWWNTPTAGSPSLTSPEPLRRLARPAHRGRRGICGSDLSMSKDPCRFVSSVAAGAGFASRGV